MIITFHQSLLVLVHSFIISKTSLFTFARSRSHYSERSILNSGRRLPDPIPFSNSPAQHKHRGCEAAGNTTGKTSFPISSLTTQWQSSLLVGPATCRYQPNSVAHRRAGLSQPKLPKQHTHFSDSRAWSHTHSECHAEPT